jgi:mono/diheme cytochrome c family protein
MVRRKSFQYTLASFIVALILTSACAPDPTLQLISPNMVMLGEGEVFVPPTPTPRPRIAVLSQEEIYAGLPDAIADLMPGDAARGVALTVPHNCIGCHQTDNSLVEVAPTWLEVADIAVGRARQTGAAGPAAYIYNSMINPDDFIVSGYTSGEMPQTFSEDMNQQELADLLTYLLSLRAE